MATVFYEPSTRTRFSFESAMLRLGGSVISSEAAGHFSSAYKGETLEDSIRVIGSYADIIVLRHPEVGASERAIAVSTVPIVNAGDGAGEHPTQALLDLYTIRTELGRLENMTIALIGDLKNGRTIHSLIHLLGLIPTMHIILVSPESLQLPDELLMGLRATRAKVTIIQDLKQALLEADVVYMTRIQKERFNTPEEYNSVKGSYILGPTDLPLLKLQSVILHPLPRIDEIHPSVDNDARAAYFRQTKHGLFLRMALIDSLL